ncbi:MAG: telomere binding protein [Pleopsidium flavum]|nr:MAG: telomere binding protein [Pleopsidium flavum]
MEDLLTPLKTRITASHDEWTGPLIHESQATKAVPNAGQIITSPDEALEALYSKPDYGTLRKALQYLNPDLSDFKIKLPTPKAAQLVNVLVANIIPDYWGILDEKSSPSRSRNPQKQNKERDLLLQCLSSVVGLGAILAQLRSLNTLSRDGIDKSINSGLVQRKKCLLGVLEAVIGQDTFLLGIWTDVNVLVMKPIQKTLLWKEFVSLIASGKIPSISAEAKDTSKLENDTVEDDSWLANGSKYSVWLGRNIVFLASKISFDHDEGWTALAQLLGKSYSLGYTDHIIEEICSGLLLKDAGLSYQLRALLNHLLAHERRTFLYSLLRIMPKKFMIMSKLSDDNRDVREDMAIGGAAALIAGVIKDNNELTDSLITWLSGPSGGGVGADVSIRRAALAALSNDLGAIQVVLEKNMQIFGDELYIKHTPILHQEVNAQVLLLAVGYVYRSNQVYLSTLARSSIYLNTISNRLAASSPRARFLGMITGVAISVLVDPPDKKMKFSMSEMNIQDAHWYRTLVSVQDSIGSIKDLKLAEQAGSSMPINKNPRSKPDRNGEHGYKPFVPQVGSKIISIEEVDEQDDQEDDDLAAYEKPDSDEEDEDEDPTLIQRNKPTAPVYILDLVAGLRDTDNYDRQRLVLSNAASLIRRKASFGSEVSDHIEELATLLVGLSDKFEMERFQERRLQGMIAVLVAQPSKMGQWFAETFFEGDYSMAQRASTLTTLGMGARELAGFKEQDAALTGADVLSENSFPSKMLPKKLHKVYAIEASPIDATVKRLEKLMIKPMAVEAADKLTGPNALKVRTFSSRMEVEKKRKKAIPNELAKLVAESFFFPLTGRWWIHLQAYGNKSIQFSPILLTAYLKTLALILHASGASTLSLPQMTSEFWDLLLSLRAASSGDSTVLEALLFAFLTLLEINEDKRRIAQDHSKELLETQEWAQQVFEGARGGDEEGERIRMLAAGVLVRTREVVEKHQRMLMGDMFDF